MPENGRSNGRSPAGDGRELLERLVVLAQYRDDPTQGHADRVGRTAGLLAAALGRPADECAVIRLAAPLHDLGMIGVSDAILLKRSRLTPEQFESVKAHTLIGWEILTGADSTLLCTAAEIALTHHERWDGRGYPVGLGGEAIPLAGRITALADVFDALSQPRPYKRALTIPEAVAEVRAQSGAQFDPAVVAAFETLDAEALARPVEPAEVAQLAAAWT